MTTTITISTHSWPVKVETTDRYGNNEPVTEMTTVEPNSSATVYIYQQRTVTFTELSLPDQTTPTTEELRAAAVDAGEMTEDEGDAGDTLKA